MSFTLRAKRMLVTAATGALVLSLFPAVTASADTESVCENAPDAGFSDSGTTHGDNIDCMTAYGIGQGYGDGTYGTFDPLTRGQAASLIYLFAGVATDGAIEDDIDETEPVPFTDMGTTHAEGISALYRLDLVQGTTTTTYSPNAPITRAQYATILFNAHVALGTDFEASYTTNFTDIDGSIHEDAIAALEGEGVISGTTATTYTPAGFITRGANASLLALSAGVLDDAGNWMADRLAGPVGPNMTFTDAPELVEVEHVGDDVVHFEFDEVVTGQALRFEGSGASREYVDFRLYDTGLEVLLPTEARIEGDTVITRFPAVDLGDITRAGTRYNAVEDVTGVPSIEGDFPFQADAVPGAETDPYSPQLVSVDNYRLDDIIVEGEQDILVDFTFDGPLPATVEADVDADAEDFHVVGSNSAIYSGAAFDGAFTTTLNDDDEVIETVVTVVLAADPEDVPESQLRRGHVFLDEPEAGSAVAPIDDQILLAAEWESEDGNTVDPDLVSIERRDADEWRFEFDEAISDAAAELDETAFYLYTADGSLYHGSAIGRSAIADDDARVAVVTFTDTSQPDDIIADSGPLAPVGGFVVADAVRGTDNTASDVTNGFNQPDEVEITPPDAEDPTEFELGNSGYPDLLRLERSQNPVTEQYEVSFVFDADEVSTEDACDLADRMSFDLYDTNGTQFRADDLAGASCSTDGDEVIVTFDNDVDSDSAFTNEQMVSAVTGGVETTYATNDVDDVAAVGDTVVSEGQEEVVSGPERGDDGGLINGS